MSNSDSLFKRKRFLLIVPRDYDIYKLFFHNLRKMELDVFPLEPYKFRYEKFYHRILNFFQKTFFQNKKFKKRLLKTYYSRYVCEKISNVPPKSIDYVLIIRVDLLTQEAIQKVLSIGKKVITYQWDGLDRFPSVFECINHFEKFYVFDPSDYKKYKSKYPNIELSHNFFFDFDIIENEVATTGGVFYMGAYIENRVNDIFKVLDEIEKYDKKVNIQLFYSRRTLPFVRDNVHFVQKQVCFSDYLKQVQQSEILLDFKTAEHEGLSFRFFEALKYEKKIITNNVSVMNYDFYRPNNIFIFNRDNLADLGKFLHSKYEKIPPEIVQKYAFSSWLYRYFS